MTADGRDVLGVLWRARRWSLLLNLIDHLPSNSHYTDARANDDELAELLGDDDSADAGVTRPRIAHWSPERGEIVRVGDLIVQLIDTVRELNRNPRSGLQPALRPETSFDRRDRRRGLAEHEQLARHLTAVPDQPA